MPNPITYLLYHAPCDFHLLNKCIEQIHYQLVNDVKLKTTKLVRNIV